MKRIIEVTFVICILVCSCSNTSKDMAANNICNEWKLAGFVDVPSSDMKYAEPDDEWCYVLTFIKGGKLSGMSSTNSFEGAYKIDYFKNSINISIGFMTKVCEYLDGELYMESLKNVHFFSLEKDELKLYYNNRQNYLLFKIQ